MPEFSEVFNKKKFNARVWGKYQDSLPSLFKDELLKSEAITDRGDIAQQFPDQNGGYYMVMPLVGDLPDDEPDNYDGSTDITTSKLGTYTGGRIVIGRAHSWEEKDFTKELTGKNFMEDIAAKTNKYWDKVQFRNLISTVNGIFNMNSGSENLKFVNQHTFDISPYADGTGKFGATTMNQALQRAVGDHSDVFKLTAVHSQIAANMRDLKLMEFAKYTDPNGITRQIALGTIDGKRVLITDQLPVATIGAKSAVVEKKGVYSLEITTAAKAGDTFTFKGNTYVCSDAKGKNGTKGWKEGSNVTDDATALVKILGKDFEEYTFTNTAGVITITQKAGLTETTPAAVATGTMAVSISVTTAGVTPVSASAGYNMYTSYVFGTGAIEHTSCPVKQPAEPYRDPFVQGGKDYLIERKRDILSPFGISFENTRILSPTRAQLEDGSNWSLCSLLDENGTQFIEHRYVPIVRIISRG